MGCKFLLENVHLQTYTKLHNYLLANTDRAAIQNAFTIHMHKLKWKPRFISQVSYTVNIFRYM